jgi:hypothetical protein
MREEGIMEDSFMGLYKKSFFKKDYEEDDEIPEEEEK